MGHLVYLAWRYLVYHKIKTAILVASIMLIAYLPVGLNVLVRETAAQLTARAEATPLLVGEKGSPLELVLNSLYFESDAPARMRYAEVLRIDGSGLARGIPVNTRFRSRGHPIVGTTLDYFDYRGLGLAEGRWMAMLGECVVGSRVARSLGVGPGGHVVSSPESVFDLAGVYPLKMGVAGVLRPTGTPDDEAVFVDVKTTWVIEGLCHGHQDMSKPEAAPGVLRRDGDNVIANASVVQYNEITPDNVDSFHFHGDTGEFPVTAAIAVPRDSKSAALLRGRYLAPDERVQIVEPVAVMEDLLATILTVQSYVIAAVVLLGLSTLATATLVFLLSLRLRRREIETMVKIGGARIRILSILTSEIAVVLMASAALAAGLTALTARFGSDAIRMFLLQ